MKQEETKTRPYSYLDCAYRGSGCITYALINRMDSTISVVLGSNPAGAVSLRKVGNSIYPTLPVSFGRGPKNVGPFHLVSMPGEVKDPTQRVIV